MNTFSRWLLVGLLGANGGLACAEPYQVELGGAFGYIDSDQSEAIASAEMYFIPVNPDKNVLAEAAFLARASSLKVRYGKASYLYDGEKLLRGDEVVDFTYTEFAIDWYGTTTGLYLGFSQETFSPDDEESEHENIPDYDNWTVNFGFMPLSGILVYTSYEEEQGYDPNFAVKYVSELNNGKAVNLETRYIDYSGDDSEDGESERQNYLMVGLDIYFSRELSVGGTISQQDDTVFGLRSRYFFNPSFSAGVFARSGDDVEEFGLSAKVRF